MRILVLNGPNLNLLGERQPEIYGTASLADARSLAEERANALGAQVDFRQSNHEGVLIDWVHEARAAADALVVNAGAYTHTSIALMDALNCFDGPVVEAHLSHVGRRESFRRRSYVALAADASLAGLGVHVYPLAVEAAYRLWSERTA